LTAYLSRTGQKWNLFGSTTLRMPSSVFVGLALTARNQQALNTAMFDRVSVSSAVSQAPALPAPISTTPSLATPALPVAWGQHLINWETPAAYPAYAGPIRTRQRVFE
jgi:hypothetical protein